MSTWWSQCVSLLLFWRVLKQICLPRPPPPALWSSRSPHFRLLIVFGIQSIISKRPWLRTCLESTFQEWVYKCSYPHLAKIINPVPDTLWQHQDNSCSLYLPTKWTILYKKLLKNRSSNVWISKYIQAVINADGLIVIPKAVNGCNFFLKLVSHGWEYFLENATNCLQMETVYKILYVEVNSTTSSKVTTILQLLYQLAMFHLLVYLGKKMERIKLP